MQFANNIFRLCKKYSWHSKRHSPSPHLTPSSPIAIIMDEFAQSPNFSMDYIFSIKPSNIQNKSNISSSPHDHVPVSTKQEQKLQQEIVNTPLFLNLVALNLNKPICCQEQAPVKVRNLETDV